MENIKKIYINDMDEDKRNELIKKNQKLMDILQDDLYQYNMERQLEEGEYMLGKEQSKYIEIRDNYSSFYLVLKNWTKFIENLDKDYLSTEGIELYNLIIKQQEELYNLDYYSENYNELEETIEENCKRLLKICEDLLHEWEQLPDEDDAIQYADEMEQLNDYYIEVREDGTSDNVIRKDVSYTECYI